MLHEFALSLHCTVAELRQRMPHREWLDWLAFFRARPMPQQRTDYLLGEILSAIRNQGAFTKVERRVDAFDVVPWLKAPPKPEPDMSTREAIEADKELWRVSIAAQLALKKTP